MTTKEELGGRHQTRPQTRDRFQRERLGTAFPVIFTVGTAFPATQLNQANQL